MNSIGGNQQQQQLQQANNVTPSTSPTAFLVPKSDKRRKSKDESPSSSSNGGSVVGISSSSSSNSNLSSTIISASSLKKPKTTASPCAISPVLIECPEQDCSKKYKHANGLKYHQSHAHGIITNTEDETLLMPPDSPNSFQCSNSSTSADKGTTENTGATFNKCLEPSVVDKPLSIKSVLQINEVQGTLTAALPINDESKATNAGDDSFLDTSIKSLDPNDTTTTATTTTTINTNNDKSEFFYSFNFIFIRQFY